MKKTIIIVVVSVLVTGGAGLIISRMQPRTERPSVTLNVSGMVCAACVVSVQKSLQKVPGVEKARISPVKAEALITLEDTTGARRVLIDAIRSAGFDARPAP
ncbi:MAG: heavy-metal-associated domain-containing protein [Chitinispirillaceae bacterium]|jgi:copper chaperone CopZ|nr:heavy-metal-associated domain-containing protein [Chitinispirillaceae bacterium]